jgi:cytochrome P450
VICELLGVPYDDRDDFQTWSEALLTTTSLTDEQRMSYLANLGTYMAGLIAQRRAQPTADLLSAMVQARDADDRLSEDELLFLAIGLLAAGHETTASQIPNFVYLLVTHPDQLALLRDRPELLPGGVEELMRYVPFTAVSTIPRYATEDVELAGGLVRAGEPAIVSRSAANRDPSVFPDPERLDVTRTTASHFGFGYGAHHCLGAQLARVELQVALHTLLTGLPGLRLAIEEDALPWKKGLFMRGLHRMPIAWDTL